VDHVDTQGYFFDPFVLRTQKSCDGADLGGQSCAGLGFDGGSLACATDCGTYDTSGCTRAAACGNDIVESGELCDGSALGGASCTDVGFDGGSLACATDCSAYDTSGCTLAAACGNDIVESEELCDGSALGGQSCAGLGYDSGTLACAADCSGYDTSACTSADRGIKDQIVGIQEQLVQIEGGVEKLGESVDEIATARSAICDRPVSWNRKLPDNERFVPALNGHAYCDLETGLIWMETPPASYVTWKRALALCRITEVDGRMGWNMPTVEQLSTLIDLRNLFSGPVLPRGHPFKGKLDDVFWTSSFREQGLVGRTRQVYLIGLDAGTLTWRSSEYFDEVEARVWCVRGAGGSPPISEVSFFGED
jgi:hypothetical protein